MYSAKRVGGVRLYRKARRGEEVDRPPVRIRIERLELKGFEGDRFELRIRCSKGTYIRSLVHDLGRNLGCGAVTDELRRVRSGPFPIEEAHRLSDLHDHESIRRALRPSADALQGWPTVWINENGREVLRHGRPLATAEISRVEGVVPEGRVRLLDETGALVGLARWIGADRELARPYRVFLTTPSTP
jgi:tRNA pseudouridine55 synthase